MAVPLLVETHEAHRTIVRWSDGRRFALAGHAVAETYAVLTRLPGDLRLAPVDAARLMTAALKAPLMLGGASVKQLPQRLAELDIAGGAVHDALVALAAAEHGVSLATRDARARQTYERVGVPVVLPA